MMILNFKCVDHTKIPAIKIVRMITTISLREARDAVEEGLILDQARIEPFLWHFQDRWQREFDNLPMPQITVRYWNPPRAPFQLPTSVEIAMARSF